MRSNKLVLGESVKIETPWADGEFPNCCGTVVELRNGGAVAVIETAADQPLRTLHVTYLR